MKLGQMVYYMRHGSPNGQHKPEQSPAVITRVLNQDTKQCQLFVMNPNGIYFDTCDYAETPKPGHWSYVPLIPENT